MIGEFSTPKKISCSYQNSSWIFEKNRYIKRYYKDLIMHWKMKYNYKNIKDEIIWFFVHPFRIISVLTLEVLVALLLLALITGSFTGVSSLTRFFITSLGVAGSSGSA